MALTPKERDSLAASDFAVPDGRLLPIHDRSHTSMAWRVVDNTKGLSLDQRMVARSRILAAAHSFGIDTSKWLQQSMSFSAMALEFPEEAEAPHPNKLPFTGILTRLDRPSDKPLSGTGGKRVTLSRAVAESSVGSLLGMGVDFKPNFDGHRPRVKIGLITAAWVEGDAIKIAGFFYAADFPEEVQTIQTDKALLGFSFEAQSLMQDLKSDPLVVEACEFTGAAVLYKDKAAYYDTSIAANADQETQMNEEQIKQLNALTASLKTLTDTVGTIAAAASPEAIAAAVKKAMPVAAQSVLHMVSPHAAALRQCAANMTAAGIGCHASGGHAVVLNKMADKMEAEAAMGAMPTVFRDHDFISGSADTEAIVKKATDASAASLKVVTDGIASLTTVVNDLKTKIAANGEPNKDVKDVVKRKTLAAGDLASLKKLGLEANADTVLSVADFDAAARKANLPMQQSMTLKLVLRDAGYLS